MTHKAQVLARHPSAYAWDHGGFVRVWLPHPSSFVWGRDQSLGYGATEELAWQDADCSAAQHNPSSQEGK